MGLFFVFFMRTWGRSTHQFSRYTSLSLEKAVLYVGMHIVEYRILRYLNPKSIFSNI